MPKKKSGTVIIDGEEARNTNAISFGGALKVINEGAAEKLKELLNQGLNINMTNDRGKTLLMIQCINHGLKGVKLLLEYGADAKITDFWGNSALILACRHHKANCKEECAKIIKLLTAKGADMNSASVLSSAIRHEGYGKGTALFEACIRGRVEVVRLLLELGADINVTHQNPLVEACTFRRINVVKLLISYGADVNARNHYGHTSLGQACGYGFDDIVEVLLNHGADMYLFIPQGPNKLNPLIIACMNGNVSTVKLLLDRGADVNYMCDGRTPLQTACYYGDIRVARYLLKRGADSNASSPYGLTPLMTAARDSCNCFLLNLLLEYGADINTECRGHCALSIAAEKYWRENVILLLERGADLFKEDGITPVIAYFSYSIFTSDPDIAALVKQYGELNKRANREIQPLLK